MMPPVYALLIADSTVTGLVSARIYPFGEAPQGVAYPYVTWQVITALPENCLSSVPPVDAYGVQIDVWASTVASCLAVAEAVRDKLELSAHMTAFGGTERSSDTRAYRYRMDFQFWTNR